METKSMKVVGIASRVRRAAMTSLTALVMVAMVAGTSVADVQPASVDATLAAGESMTVEKTVDVPEVTPKLDLVLDVDLSGSYGDDISTIKALKSDIFNGVRSSVPDSTFGLVSFVDYPFSPWGAASSGDYAYQRNQDLTATQSTWEASIMAMVLRFGADGPESQLESLYQAATGAGRDLNGDGDFTDLGEVAPAGVSFRADATKVIAITTDASMHVRGDPGSFPYPGPSMADTIAALNAAGIHVVAIKAPGSTTQMDQLAAATDGAVVTTSSSSAGIVNAILSALEALTFDVSATPVGCDPLEVSLSPASYADVAGGTELGFTETIHVPDGTPGGVYECEVHFLADGTTLLGVQTIRITTNSAPDCANVVPSQSVMWPPNHQFVAIGLSGASDADGDDVSVLVTSIFQDEPTDSTGDGNAGPDGDGVGTDTASIRAERTGTPENPGNGRVYHIGFTADDGNGGSCSGTVQVGVPHERKDTPADEGALYDSLV